MIEPLTNYLGKPASALLASPPFKFWPFERSVEGDLPERPVDYVFPQHGLELTCDNDEKIHSIFLKSDSFDQALLDIPFSSSRSDVLSLLGVPSKSGGAHTHPILGEYGAWDLFARPGHAIHVGYRADADRIRMVTLMRADVVP